MSRPTFRHRAGLILTLVAFVLGATAATALGWVNEQPTPGKDWNHGKNEGKNHGKNEGKGGHGKKNEKPPPVKPPQPPPPPPPPVTPTPPAVAPPPAAAAPSPVVPLSTPSPTSPNVKAKGVPGGSKGGGQGGQQGGNSPAEVAPGTSSPTLAPAVERQKLAATGLNPALMALLGALCLGGGALLFRRALSR